MHNTQVTNLFKATVDVRKGAPMGNQNVGAKNKDEDRSKAVGGFAAVLKGAPLGNDNAAGPHKPFTRGGGGGAPRWGMPVQDGHPNVIAMHNKKNGAPQVDDHKSASGPHGANHIMTFGNAHTAKQREAVVAHVLSTASDLVNDYKTATSAKYPDIAAKDKAVGKVTAAMWKKTYGSAPGHLSHIDQGLRNDLSAHFGKAK